MSNKGQAMVMLIPVGKSQVAIVDDEDFALVSRYKWLPQNDKHTTYALHSGRKKRLLMHTLVLGTKPGCETDHRNGNGLDNRRCNLRFATRSQNNANRKKFKTSSNRFKGVCRTVSRIGTVRWRAIVSRGGRRYDAGSFIDEESAARAYDRKLLELYGEFARLNFPL